MQELPVTVTKTGPARETPRVFTIDRISRPLFLARPSSTESLLGEVMLCKEQDDGFSQQSTNLGIREHPFDMVKAKDLTLANEHHSTCLYTKTNATVGLGFLTEEERKAREAIRQGNVEAKTQLMSVDGISKADEVLNPLCRSTWQEVLSDVGQDFWTIGNGYLEVVRDRPNGPITGIYHIPGETVHIDVEDETYNFHYVVSADRDGGGERRFSRFGDLKNFNRRRGGSMLVPRFWSDVGRVSEVIHFRQPTALSRWYGMPDWLSAVATIELAGCLKQHKYDFFLNRGVPEFFLWILGQKLSDDDWKIIEQAIKSNIGLGNSHKTCAVNLDGENVTVQVDKMAMESVGEDEYASMNDVFAVSVVTAHRVPPLLAGILIPGKLGATNELPNALTAFQALVVGQAQRLFSQILGTTLGNAESNGGLDLKPEDFIFRRITEQFDMGAMDTIARMRETVPEANAKGRNIKAGLKKEELAEGVHAFLVDNGHTGLADKIAGFIREQQKAA